MLGKVMQAIKRENKKGSINITLSVVIGFLLSCTSIFGLNITEESSGEIKFDGSGYDEILPLYKENTFENNMYTNNMDIGEISLNGVKNSQISVCNNGTLLEKKIGIDIKDSEIGNIYNTGEISTKNYGIKISSSTMNNIDNKGLIINESKNSSIMNMNSIMNDILNKGIIFNSSNLTQGVGIWNYTSSIKNINNNGLIITVLSNSTGSNYGISNTGIVSKINNTGLIKGIGGATGYGIYNGKSSEMSEINNVGLFEEQTSIANFYGKIGKIDNFGTMTGSKYGVLNTGAGSTIAENKIDKINNVGFISVANDSGSYIPNGISNQTATIGSVKNNGIISVIVNSDKGRGYGIHNMGELSEFENTGSIIARGKIAGVGINNQLRVFPSIKNSGIIAGISPNSSAATSDIFSAGVYSKDSSELKIDNTGVIYGSDSAILAEKAAVNINNFGLIVSTKGKKIISSKSETLNNKGIVFKAKVDSGYIITERYDETGKIDVTENSGIREMTVLNAEIKGDNANSTGTESFLGKNYENHILNGITNTLKISGKSNKVKGSVINGYTTAVKFDGSTDNSLSISGSTVNGGIAENTAAILGGNGSDELILDIEEVIYKSGTKKINTIINGNVDLGDGNNTLILKNGTTINGEIKLGSGDDILTLEENNIINGNINIMKGNNEVTIKENNIVNGNISLGTESDTLILDKNNIVNGNISLNSGDDNLIIGNGNVINGILDGGDGNKDVLTFGKTGNTILLAKDTEKILIFNDISEFETIDINTDVTFFEKTIDDSGKLTELKVTGAGTINIQSGGNLTLRVNGMDRNTDDKIKGHALYENIGKIISQGTGTLTLAVYGLGEKEIIDFKDNDLSQLKNENIKLTSKLHGVANINNGLIEIAVKENLPSDNIKIENYIELNKIFNSVKVSGQMNKFPEVKEDDYKNFLSYLAEIYTLSPSSYSSELSRKSMGMFRDIVTESSFKPETNKWMIYGGLTHIDGGTKDTYYGKGYYTYDIGSSDIEADIKINGAYMLGEYGISDTFTSGVVIGGNKLKSDLSNDSKVDGDALYIGGYAKKYLGNLKVTTGAGFQYGDYDADRIAAGREITETRSYSSSYNDLTYDIYLNGRYSHNIGDNLYLEPYATLSYTYVDQDGADEGNKTLAIETDSQSFDYTVGKIGVDLKKVIPHEKGKSILSAGVSYTRLLNGADEEYITGRFKGGSDFDILVAHKNEHSLGLNAKYALELENGILFDVKGSYAVERDSHNGTGKNKAKGEWIVGAGLGYKF